MPHAVGESVAIRDVRQGVVYFAWPFRVVEAGPRGLFLAQRPGALGRVPVGYPEDRSAMLDQLADGRPTLVELEWSRTVTLGICVEDANWLTRLFWDHESGDFLSYYVDFVRPLRLNADCVDTSDLALDIVVTPEGTWSLKDEDEYAHLRATGWINDADHEQVERALPEVTRTIERGAFPFDGSLLEWQWPADLDVGVLPPGWER